ncbi:hypothetical protein BH10BAC3_BH10BAC3_24410 [soil metagenome]
MDISTIIPHIEALIFASEKPLATLELVELVNNALGFIEDRASLDQVESAMDAIREKYESEFYPFEVKESGGGWQFLTKGTYHKTVAQLNGEKFLKKLSTAALETLSIIAYKQPVTKGEIENIRGVNCDYAVQKLLEKELIVITGRRENAPGQPLIYATSKSFMDYFGINTVDDLPRLQDIMSGENVSATTVGNANPVDEDIPMSDNNTLVVNEAGDIEEVALAISTESDEISIPVINGDSQEMPVADINDLEELPGKDNESEPIESNDGVADDMPLKAHTEEKREVEDPGQKEDDTTS